MAIDKSPWRQTDQQQPRKIVANYLKTEAICNWRVTSSPHVAYLHTNTHAQVPSWPSDTFAVRRTRNITLSWRFSFSFMNMSLSQRSPHEIHFIHHKSCHRDAAIVAVRDFLSKTVYIGCHDLFLWISNYCRLFLEWEMLFLRYCIKCWRKARLRFLSEVRTAF
jgi:hypothetical protein